MRFARLLFGASWLALIVGDAAGADRPLSTSADERTLLAAGLWTDGESLLDFIRARSDGDVSQDKLKAKARRLGDPDMAVRSKAVKELVGAGAIAIPVLRRAVNDLDNSEAATRARRCLERIEGPGSAAIPAAAARLIAVRRPSGSAEVLLAYLPYSDDATVIGEVGKALDALAQLDGKAAPALVKALEDDVPLRRALAGAALCRSGQAELTAAARKLLRDSRPMVRMHVALALGERLDVEAIGVLIDLLADLSSTQREPVMELLQDLAGDWSPDPKLQSDDDVSRKALREAWAGWWRCIDGPALLAEFRKRTLSPAERDKVACLIRQLGDESFTVRDGASADLVAYGALAVPLLRQASRDADEERARRAQDCLGILSEKSDRELPVAAPRLLALRKPRGAIDALLDYAPFANDEEMRDEIENALARLAVADGKPDAALMRSLEDKQGLRRALAAGALARSGGAEQRAAVIKLLADTDLQVRFRAAMGLASAGQKDAVPVLIDLLAELPREKTWRAVDFLERAAGNRGPALDLGADVAANCKCRDSWAAWWKEHGAALEMPGPGSPAVITTTPCERSNAAAAFAYLSAMQSSQERYQAQNGTYADDVTKLDMLQRFPKCFEIGTMTANENSWALTLTRKGGTRFGRYTVGWTQLGFEARNSTIADDRNEAINPRK